MYPHHPMSPAVRCAFFTRTSFHIHAGNTHHTAMFEQLSTFPGYDQVLTGAKKLFGRIIQTGPVPKHVAIIMDGNRRYARNHKMEIREGHNIGFETMASVLELLFEAGVECATVYAFSIENFKRLAYEVEALMDMARLRLCQIRQHGELCEKYGVRLRVVGNRKLLPVDVQQIVQETEDMTKNNSRAVLYMCFPYTARDDMTQLIRNVVAESLINPEFEITESAFNHFLYTPPLDLLIRTSGTYRLSDFLLWQSVLPKCSVVFSDRLWPEFSPLHMAKILLNWSFNTYWYGHGNGFVVLAPGDSARAQKSPVPVPDSAEDDYTDSSSDAAVEEEDTFTSDEDPISK